MIKLVKLLPNLLPKYQTFRLFLGNKNQQKISHKIAQIGQTVTEFVTELSKVSGCFSIPKNRTTRV